MREALKAVALFLTGVLCSLAQASYDQPFRPQFHFSPQMYWTNDPCGLVYAFGEYQLFFQHNPFGNVWGHMSWGHAVSSDLVHWTQLPVAIPEDKSAAIFTGSSVVDTDNTSGLCTSPKSGCIVSIYTGFTSRTATTPARQTQNLAFSQDGRSWEKYSGNPVLDLGRSDTRDPRVFWYAPSKQWIMVIVLANEKKVRLFGSSNLKQWHYLSDFGPQGATGGVWECPDLYSLPVPGQVGESRWILQVGINPGHISGGSGEQYFVGRFDGTRFRNENIPVETHWLDYGRDCYCALTFNEAPTAGAPRMIGWMNNWQYAGAAPTAPWRGAMTLSRSLSLWEFEGAITLIQTPVKALESLREDTFRYQGDSEADLNRGLAEWPHRSQTFELDATIRPGTAKQITWRLLQGGNDQTLVGFDADKEELFVDRSHSANAYFSSSFPSKSVAPLQLGGESLRLQIFVDRSSVEVFAQGGRVVMTNLVFPKPASIGLSFSASGGRVENVRLSMWRLRSAWMDLHK